MYGLAGLEREERGDPVVAWTGILETRPDGEDVRECGLNQGS